MKNGIRKWIVTVCFAGILAAAGCQKDNKVVQEPPQEILHPENAGNLQNNTGAENAAGNGDTGKGNNGGSQPFYDGAVFSGAVSAKIGLNDDTEYMIDMYNTAATDTILGYLSESEMRFPTYTYNEEGGYVAQNIRGTYTRDDEQDISEIHAGELYLFSDGQLRLYFKDLKNAGITATPIGYFADDITGLVENAWEGNRDDVWNVEVYFLIKKNEIKKQEANSAAEQVKEETKMIYAHIGDNVLEILPADNSSAKAFTELLQKGDITVDMSDYGNFEKVGSLGSSLPANDEHITTEAGDVILYQGNSITIYYDTNTWNFTRLGKVQGLSGAQLKEVLGDGSVTVRFSLD